jgi:quinoprotein glucose dehydrogenase
LDPADPVPVILRGLRNSQSFEWHPTTGAMVLVDHGPSGLPHERGRVGNDELNITFPGADLGWPVVAGASEGGGLHSPVVEWTSAIAPGGLAVTSDPESPWGIAAFVTGLRDGVLRRLPFDEANPSRVTCSQPILDRGYGRLRLVAAASDGSLWVGTSNRDRRGGPRPGDDLVLRIEPVASAPVW